MATCDEIEDALACMECCDALETHLEYCEHDDCGVFETYWRTRHRVEAGVSDDWLAPGRAAMVAMMTAEAWMHEHHDHRIVHDNPATLDVTDQGTQPALARVDGICEARGAALAGPLSAERMADLARQRLARLTANRRAPAAPPATEGYQPDPPPWWEIHGPAGLVELHVEMTLREVLRRAERLANIDADPEALEWERLREHNVDELHAARTLLWAASDWLETDDVLGLVATAARQMEWSHRRARDLFSDLLDGNGKPER